MGTDLKVLLMLCAAVIILLLTIIIGTQLSSYYMHQDNITAYHECLQKSDNVDKCSFLLKDK